jgi:hypothetical protein
MSKSRETIPLMSRPKKTGIFFHGHDGYQKNPLLMQISQMSSYITDKCTYKKVQAKML